MATAPARTLPLLHATALHTGADLLTDQQKTRLTDLFDVTIHGERMSGSRRALGDLPADDRGREPDGKLGEELMVKLIDSISHGVPAALTEITTLGRTLKKRAVDVRDNFDRPGTSN